ncbi:MAG: hypothetical protein ABI851_16710 [Saprospiraceae bacterium]
MRKVITMCVFCIAFMFNSKTQAQQQTTKMEYIEIAKFKLKEGFTDTEFLEAEKLLRNGEIQTFDGYICRNLYKDSENNWVIILKTADKKSMETLLQRLKEKLPDSFKPYASMIDFSTIRMEFYQEQNIN